MKDPTGELAWTAHHGKPQPDDSEVAGGRFYPTDDRYDVVEWEVSRPLFDKAPPYVLVMKYFVYSDAYDSVEGEFDSIDEAKLAGLRLAKIAVAAYRKAKKKYGHTDPEDLEKRLRSAGANANPSNPFSNQLTYGDFSRTGAQDCANAVSIDEFDYEGGGTAREIVERTWAQWEADGLEQEWLSQQDDFEGLDPHKAYEAWASGWKERVVGYVEHELERRREQQTNPPQWPGWTKIRGRWTRDLGGTGSWLVTWIERHEDDTHGSRDVPVIHRFEDRDQAKSYAEKVRSKRRGWGVIGYADVGSVTVTGGNPAERDEQRVNPPQKWWLRPSPAPRACYRTKADALKAFLDANRDIVENYGGADYAQSPAEFDAINHKYGLKGKRAARSIADAVWYAMPVGKPYCLDRIDLDALNDTSPAREAGVAFRLPDINYELQALAEEARRYGGEEDLPDWVTEHEREPHRVFPPLPSMKGLVPYHLRLEKREPGVEVYSIGQESRPLGPPPTQDVKPVRLKLEEKEPGVETYSINPGRKFQVGDIVRRTAARMRSMGIVSGPVNGMVVGYSGKWPLIRWSDMDDNDEPMTQAEEGLELDMRAMARAKGNPKDNPAWVTKIISKHYVDLEDEVPAKWLPKLTKTSASGGKFTATMKEYGCGAYGCVLPTLDPAVVLKLTTDSTEAEFAHLLADKLSRPVVVKYHLTRSLPDRYRSREAYLLWRDSAKQVGEVIQAVAERGGDQKAADKAIAKQHKAAQDAYDALNEGRPAEKLLDKWVEATDAMGDAVPELSELAKNMIAVFRKDKVFFGDVHDGNIGLVNGHWVIVDPGHVAVLTGSPIDPMDWSGPDK